MQNNLIRFIFDLKRILPFAMFLLAVGNPFLLFGQCPQNNFTVAGFELRDESGNPFSVTDDYQLGDSVNGELWIMLGGTSTNGYNLRFYFDVYVDGVLANADQYECLFSGIQAVQGVWVKVRDIAWNWGDVIDIKNIFIHWDTGTVDSNSTCVISNKNNINSQCYGNPQGFTAAVPLFPKFDFESNGLCNTTVQFSSQTIGGTPPFNYSYSWDFNDDGIIDSTVENPLYNFPSSGTYPITLTVNDGTSITTVVKEIFIDPNFDIQVTIFPTKVDEDSGIIYVQSVTGGTEPYTFYWTGPNGFTSTSRDIFNLSNGMYTLVVTDENGCTQTVTYELDIAQVLGSFWQSVDIFGDGSEIKIQWEVTSKQEKSYFEIERSSGDISNFVCIGSVDGKISGGETEVYVFTDNSMPVLENKFYYRIVRKSDTGVDYSSVKMFIREVSDLEHQWIVYPNPSLGQDVFLKYLGIIKLNQGPLTIEYFSSSGSFQLVTFQKPPSGSINLNEVFQSLPEGYMTLRIQLGHKVEIMHLLHQ